MTDRELLQDALDALTYVGDAKDIYSGTIDALRARLSQPEPAECDGGQCGIGGYCKQCPKTQPEPEPVAWFCKLPDNKISIKIVGKPTEGNWQPLYTAPPQREWVGLTDDEYELMAEKRVTNYFFNTLDYAHDIETKLKEKNT
jgi:hypothetical protein